MPRDVGRLADHIISFIMKVLIESDSYRDPFTASTYSKCIGRTTGTEYGCNEGDEG